MDRLFIINSKGSKRTARFFRRNQAQLQAAFAGCEFLPVDAAKLQGLESYQEFDQLVLIGDDAFFHQAVKQFHGALLERNGQQSYAFIPDHKDGSVACCLELPSSLKGQIELLKKSPTLPFDLIRCHCIGTDGLPTNHLILNDALIRMPQLKLPLLFKTLVSWFRTYSGLFDRRTPTRITLFEKGEKRFEGHYLYAILLLGNKITDGPRLSHKRRFLQKRFAYYQLNGQDLIRSTANLAQLFADDGEENPNLFRGQFSDLEIRGLGDENTIVADGVPLGRLPASFTLLPKALNVVSPMTPVQKLEPAGVELGKAVKTVGNLRMKNPPMGA